MADESIRIEYNQDLHALQALLAEVQRSGDYFVSGLREVPMPRVAVEGVGALSFPVPPAQIEALIQQAIRAPYGRGEETILDESVRKVWQIPPDKVQIGGKSWTTNFAGILEQVAVGLGCEGMPISAELYKLLIYDPGGFFLAHRDTEKVKGMFGTLVLILPSAHAGGELLIRHAGREARVDLSAMEFSEIAFAAFYADCEHEVEPIREGHRVSLVYNLIHPQKAASFGESLRAPDHGTPIAAATTLLREKLCAPGGPTKLAWLLEHQYTPDGLSFSGLKSIDAARVKVLCGAAAGADCVAHLCLVHIEESGAAEPIYHGHHRRGRYDDDEDDESDDDDFEVIEVCDWRHYLNHWRDASDRPTDFGDIPLEPGELIPAGALDDEKPDDQKFMEASGNEGASFERSYLRAALVLWPRKRSVDVLLRAGPAAALPHLSACIESSLAPGAPPTARRTAVATARKIVEASLDSSHSSAGRLPPTQRSLLLHLLVRLGEVPLLENLIQNGVTTDYDGTENDALVESASLLSPARTGLLYADLVRRHMRLAFRACIELLEGLLIGTMKRPANRADMTSLGQVAESIVAGLKDVCRPAASETEKYEEFEAFDDFDDFEEEETSKQIGSTDLPRSGHARTVDAALVLKLLQLLDAWETPEFCDQAVQHLITRCEVFDPVSVLVPALPLLQGLDGARERLWEHSARFILQRSEKPPAPPLDWRQQFNISCNCSDCHELRAFAENPVEQVHRFRVRKDRRQHLHRVIERHGLDMTHQTERQGSPQTLVCTKSRRSYQRRCEQYRKDIRALQTLTQTAAKFGVHKDTLDRIKAAGERSLKWVPA